MNLPQPSASSSESAGPAGQELPSVIDVHVHLAGLGGGGSGCFVSPKMRDTLVFGILRRWLRLDPDDPGADEFFAGTLGKLVREARGVDAAVVLGMDGVYDSQGRLVPEKSHLHVPSSHVFRVCRQFPELLPGPSINPARADALDELARCDEAGAVLVKWLPPLQLFDPAERRFDRFLEEMARRQIPLLSHTGCEHTFPEVANELGRVGLLERALDTGITVIAAHCGVACPVHRAHQQLPQVLELMRRRPNLYSDVSALASLLKFQHLRRIPFGEMPGRFVHGSDYPIPSLALPFAGKLGLGKALGMTFGGNPIESDAVIKRSAGLPDEVFTTAGRLLAPRILRWRALCSSPG